MKMKDKEEGCKIVKDEVELESWFHGTLSRHGNFLEETGVLEFALLAIRNGYLHRLLERPSYYEEPNN